MTTGAFFKSAWNWQPGPLVACALLLVLYLVAVHFHPKRRFVAFMLGVGILLICLVSPLRALSDSYLFSAHVLENTLLALLVPALLVMGLPQSFVVKLAGYAPVERAERVIGKSHVAWVIGMGVILAWQVPTLFDAAYGRNWLRVAEQTSLLLGGAVFWWPILSPLPELRMRRMPDSLIYLTAACFVCIFTGVFLAFVPTLMYSGYATEEGVPKIFELVRRQWGISTSADQQLGGVIIWVVGGAILLAGVVGQFATWYAAERAEELESTQLTN